MLPKQINRLVYSLGILVFSSILPVTAFSQDISIDPDAGGAVILNGDVQLPGIAATGLNSNGVCYDAANGQLTNCDMSIVGPEGPEGPEGPIGPEGPQGVAGVDGATGPIGPAGPQGIAGADGATGPIGPAGPQGIAGADGATGPIGPAGPQGIAGADGATGPIGPAGPQGIAGANGATGPIGPAGPQGIAGADGATGPIGPAGPQGATGAMGPVGPQGPAGTSIVDGTVAGDVLTWNGNNWIARRPAATSAASSMQPFTTVSYVIALQGIFPSRNALDPFIAEIMMFGGNFAPRGWAYCDGQLLPIAQNQTIFALLGTIYGGDGITTFALPDLRGRVAVHAGRGPGLTDRRLGSQGGTETHIHN